MRRGIRTFLALAWDMATNGVRNWPDANVLVYQYDGYMDWCFTFGTREQAAKVTGAIMLIYRDGRIYFYDKRYKP